MSKGIFEGYRLSPQQERLWCLSSGAGASAFYAQCAALIEGEIDSKLLEAAVNRIIARHEILRTSLHSIDAMNLPLQVISEPARSTVQEDDLADLGEQEQAERLELLCEKHRRMREGNKCKDTLAVTLARLSNNRRVMIVSTSSLLSDKEGLKNVIRGVLREYEGRTGEDERPVQYADAAEIFNELIESEETKGGREYWERRGESSAWDSRLVIEKRRQGTFRPKVESRELSGELSERLKEVCESVGMGESAVMLSVFGVMIGRMSGENNVTMGVSYDGRTFEGLDAAVGLFARNLPINIDLDAYITFLDLTKFVSKTAHECYKRQNYFDWKSVFTPSNYHDEKSYFPYLFEYQVEEPLHSVERINYKIEIQYDYIDLFRVKLICNRTGDRLKLGFHYDSTLYDLSDISELIDHYLTLLQSAARDLHKNIDGLELLSARQKEMILNEFNRTQRNYNTSRCVHELIEEQAERRPDAMAAACGQMEISYWELNSRANRLANYLRRRQVGSGQVIGVMLGRGIEMVIGLLGVMKAGAAYLPLDANYPEQRLAYMLQDAGAKLLLMEEQYANHLPETGAAAIYLDRDWKLVAQEPDTYPAGRVDSQDLIYVMYTSGSTGSPKGAMLPHDGIVNCLCWMQETYKLGPTDKFLMKTSLNFDPSVWELFWTLWVGGTVVLAEPHRHQDSAYLVDLIAEREITSAYFVPSLLRSLLDGPGIEECRSLKRVICGGESLLSETVDQFFDQLDLEFHHSYGPTETSIAATEWTCRRKSADPVVPIGKPLGNTQIYILDSMMQPAPIGIAGELYIGGRCVGRGYLNRADLTADRFVPDAFSPEAGARFYKTGDLGRYRSDGTVEFCGRLDYQVKLRGYRIELGEIEAALRSHPKVREAVVEMCEDDHGEKRLVGYAVGAEGISVEGLREYLQGKLPEYMVPGACVLLKELPLTPNGKVDRKALPELGLGMMQPDTIIIEPRNTIELELKSIWEDVLGFDNIGVRNNFFELGGHSLKAVTLSSRIAGKYRVPFLVRNVFECPTIEEQATYLKRNKSPALQSSIVPIQTRGSRAPLFCIHPGGGGVDDYLSLAYHLGKDQPLYGIRCLGLEVGESPIRAIDSMAAAYIVEMRAVQPAGPYRIAGWSLGGIIAYEMAVQLSEAGEIVSPLIVIDSYFDERRPEEDVAEVNDHQWEEYLVKAEQAALDEYASAVYGMSTVALQALDPEERIGRCLNTAKALNLIPPDIGIDQFRRFVRVLGSNLIARIIYRPRPYRGSVVLFRTKVDAGSDHFHGLLDLAIGGTEVYEAPGEHYTLMREPNVKVIAEKLNEYLLR